MSELSRFEKDMTNEAYHSYQGVSKSGLDKIARSPAHYKYGDKTVSTRAMEIGTATHTAILEPKRFDSEYCITEANLRTEKLYKDAKKIHGGEYTLTAREAEKVSGMRRSVASSREAMSHLNVDGDAELSAFCTDPETGVTIRARFDWINSNRVAIDLKKTQDIRPEKLSKSVCDYRYHVQDAMYSFIYKQVTGEDLKAFYFLAVEENAPHSCKLFQLSDLAKEAGMFYFRRDLRAYADCAESGVWPHPDSGNGTIELTNWAISCYENDIEVMI